jgi:hypothetical protein
MSNFALATLGPDAVKADIFFGQKPPSTDWNAFMAEIAESSPSDLQAAHDALIAMLSDCEPVGHGTIKYHTIFVLQQKLRMVIRQQRGLPLVYGKLCGICAEHTIDPVLAFGDERTCIYCAEYEAVVERYVLGGRGSCSYLLPTYDPASSSWGLLFYRWDDDVFMLWTALGYRTIEDARNAVYPVDLYNRWIERNSNGAGCVQMSDLIDLDVVMTNKNLPLNPREFEALLKERIGEHLESEKDYLGHSIDWILRRYKDKVSS